VKIVLAPNAFKGSLTAAQAADAMAAGVLQACPQAERVLVPVADGGDGLVDILTEALTGTTRSALVTGPRGGRVAARFCHLPQRKTAVIEMAAASGLALLPERRRDPTQTSTVGTGELIESALALNVERIIVGIGGSATNDGGVGMATALGIRFLDARGRPVEPTGGMLGEIRHIDMDNRHTLVAKVAIEAICDVDNPLLGETGASRVYAPQKGATPDQVETLEAGLANLAAVIEQDLGLDVTTLPGGGAAGGMGAGLHAFLGAELRAGVEVVLELVGLPEALEGADLVITAEGQLDAQTAYGKAPAGVAVLARAQGIPCLALAGSIQPPLASLHEAGLSAAFSSCPGPLPLEHAMARAADLLAHATEQALRAFLAGRR